MKSSRKHGPEHSAFPAWPMLCFGAAVICAGIGLAGWLRAVNSETHQDLHRAQIRQITLALQTYHEDNGQFPPVEFRDDYGNELSWRVLLAPYLDNTLPNWNWQQSLVSATNAEIQARGAKLFQCSHCLKAPDSRETHFAVVVGERTVMRKSPVSFEDLHDDPATVIVVAELASRDIPWTKPGDLTEDQVVQGRGLYEGWDDGQLFGTLDGRVIRLTSNPSREFVRADDWRIFVDAMEKHAQSQR